MHFILDIVNAKGYVDSTISKPGPNTDPDSVENWHFNDSYIKMLIAKYIAEDEMIHTTGCQTAKDMWANLKKFHQLTSYGLITNILRTLSNMQARDGDNIPEHLLKLKNQWEKIRQFKDEENHVIYNDVYFKQQIARSLPCSWDNFTTPYIKAYASEKEAYLSPMKRIDSQQFIGFINQEYKLQISRKQEDDLLPPKGANKNPSLTSRISNPNNNNANDNSSCKRSCYHCRKIGHFKAQCRHRDKTKCSKCDCFGHNDKDCPQNQMSGSKHKGGNNNSSSSNNKWLRAQAQNADADDCSVGKAPQANIALRGQHVTFHSVTADDDLVDILDDNDVSIGSDEHCKVTLVVAHKTSHFGPSLCKSTPQVSSSPSPVPPHMCTPLPIAFTAPFPSLPLSPSISNSLLIAIALLLSVLRLRHTTAR